MANIDGISIEKNTKLKVLENGWWKGLTVEDECLVTEVFQHHLVLSFGAREYNVPLTMLDDFEVVS
ncbi:hypothetical protein [Pseudomonas serbica]|uniref:hypothetical protein n=1 Tax=Pseudomonas serbica TaxID=2965074 RepID=UPI00237A1F19|nr:hypothetical protein [Pseudomonas serbica]